MFISYSSLRTLVRPYSARTALIQTAEGRPLQKTNNANCTYIFLAGIFRTNLTEFIIYFVEYERCLFKLYLHVFYKQMFIWNVFLSVINWVKFIFVECIRSYFFVLVPMYGWVRIEAGHIFVTHNLGWILYTCKLTIVYVFFWKYSRSCEIKSYLCVIPDYNPPWSKFHLNPFSCFDVKD